MSVHDDLDLELNTYLREGPIELPYESFDAVRDRIDQTSQRAVVGLWRVPDMNRFLVFGAGAAAAVVVLLIGAQLLGSPSGGLGSQPSASAEPTPTAQPSVAEVGLPPGPLSFEPDGPFSPKLSGMTLTVTLPASGWYFDSTWILMGPSSPEDAPFIAFWAFPDEEFYVPADPCQGDSTKPETPATTVDEIAAALAAQTGRNASEPVDVMIGGYAGKSLTLHAPADVDLADCERDSVITYFTADDFFFRNTQRPDEVSELWILDVDGTIVIIDQVSSPGQVVDEMRTLVESTTFEFP